MAASAASAPLAAVRAPEPRIAAPPSFDGRAAGLDAWLAAMSRQFAWYGYATPQYDAARMRLATAYLSASAWDWWEYTPAEQKPTTWDAFVEALRRRFQPVTSADTARLKLRALAQGKATIHDYVAAFRRLLISVPSMSEDDRLFQFMQGLSPAISAQLRIHGVKTMEAAIEMATRIGGLGELNASLAAASRATVASSTSTSDPDAMQLDVLGIEGLEADTLDTAAGPADAAAPVTRADLVALLNAMREERRGPSSKGGYRDHGRRGGPPGTPQIPHLTPEQVQQHMRDGKCFGCGSAEHRARQCPKRKVGADGKPSWTN